MVSSWLLAAGFCVSDVAGALGGGALDTLGAVSGAGLGLGAVSDDDEDDGGSELERVDDDSSAAEGSDVGVSIGVGELGVAVDAVLRSGSAESDAGAKDEPVLTAGDEADVVGVLLVTAALEPFGVTDCVVLVSLAVPDGSVSSEIVDVGFDAAGCMAGCREVSCGVGSNPDAGNGAELEVGSAADLSASR